MMLAVSAIARAADHAGALSEMTVPGGVRAALDATGEGSPADRAHFVIEFARRIYQTPLASRTDPRTDTLQKLVDHLNQAARTPQNAETVPLPLTPEIWTDIVFEKRATPESLASSILRSRNPTLFYCALVALDDETRAWLAGQPDLIASLSQRDAPAFLLAASAIRVSGGAVRVIGGEPAQHVWEALVGKRASEPAAFIRTLVSKNDGRLAYFFAAMGQLTPMQLQYALGLDTADPAARVGSARRLYGVFHRLGPGWNVMDRAFWRPMLDPALLAAQLRNDANGRPIVPGTRAFWSALLAGASAGSESPDAVSTSEAPGFAWLCEQVFNADVEEGVQHQRFAAVLFASRQLASVTPDNAADALEAVRAALKYPALAYTLERAGMPDVSALASAARRAVKLSQISDDANAARALAQFQGALALLARGAMRGSLTPASFAALVTALSAVEVGEHGEYEGRIARWIDAHVADWTATAPAIVDSPDDPYANAPGPIERDLLHLVAGPPPPPGTPIVEWEGTRYRVDLSWAEAVRISRLIGDRRRPYLSAARSLAGIADAIGAKDLTREQAGLQAQQLRQIGEDVDLRTPAAWTGADAPQRFREASAALDRASRDNPREAGRQARTLLLLADDLAARGVMELAYASSMGYPTATPITADDAAGRHVFGIGNAAVRHAMAWQLPLAGAEGGGWHVTGSMLALDVRLAGFWMVPLSWAPPTHRPTLNDADRRSYMETAVLLNPAALNDAQRDVIVSALRDGRARLAAARSADEARTIAAQARLDSSERSLLPWIAAHDPNRLQGALSAVELLALGMKPGSAAPDLEAWGVNAGPRLGCLCVRLTSPSPADVLAWRWGSGFLSSAYSDVNLRITELLAEMKMPASLLGPVLSSATLELINNVVSRDQDDARGLIEFAQTLSTERLELFLALLTTDGPLVPMPDTSGPQTRNGGRR
jgi:hypothetical protein